MRKVIYWGLLLALLAGATWAGSLLWRYGDTIQKEIELERQHVAEWGAMQEEHLDPAFLEKLRTMEFENDTQRIDYLREFIFAHSEDVLDEGRDDKGVLNYKNLLHMTSLWSKCLEPDGHSCTKPELKCDHRAKAMIAILQSEGIEARLVHLFNPGLEGAREDHSVCEVLNPDSGRWELQDSYYNCYFVPRAGAQERAGALELLYQGVTGFAPCNDSGCGWEHARPDLERNYENLLRGVVFDNREDARPSMAVVSLERVGSGATPEKVRGLEYYGYMQRNFGGLLVVFD